MIKVVIINNDELFIPAVLDLFESEDVEIVNAINGVAGLRMVEELKPDFIGATIASERETQQTYIELSNNREIEMEKPMKTILVIEDDKDHALLISYFLKIQGFQIIIAENGLNGLHLAKTHKPDLIICDIGLPVMDGFTVLKELRNDVNTDEIPFIFVTGQIRVDSRNLAMELGANDYLNKPLDLSNLLAAITKNLKS